MLSNYLMKRVTKLTGSDECRVPFPTHPKSDVQKCYILEEAGVEVEILNENILHSLCYHSTEKLVWRAEKKFHFPSSYHTVSKTIQNLVPSEKL